MLARFNALLELMIELESGGLDASAYKEYISRLEPVIFDLGEALSEADFQAQADFLVLLGERLVACHHSSEAVLAEQGTNGLLIGLFSAPDATLATQAVDWLCDPQWPEPLLEVDADFLRLLLDEASDAERHPFKPSDLETLRPTQEAPNQPVQRFDQQLVATLDHRQREPFDLKAYSVALELFASHCFDKRLSGLSDAVAFYLEGFSEALAHGVSLTDPLFERALSAFTQLATSPSLETVDELLAALSSPQWPLPLDSDDAEYLKPLLLDDVQILRQLLEAVSSNETADNEVAAATELVLAEEPASEPEVSLRLGDELKEILLTQLQPDMTLANFSERLVSLSDELRDVDLHGLCDLFALYSEALSQGKGSHLSLHGGTALALNQGLVRLMEQPSSEVMAAFVQQLSQSLIQEPLLEDDQAFLLELLEEDMHALSGPARLNASIDPVAAINEPAIDLVEASLTSHDSEESDIELEERSFSSESAVIDVSCDEGGSEASSEALSEESSAQASDESPQTADSPAQAYLRFHWSEQSFDEVAVDQTVLTMLADTLKALCDAWQAQPLSELSGLLDTTSNTLAQVNRAIETLSLSAAHALIEGLVENIAQVQQNDLSPEYQSTSALRDCLLALSEYLTDLGTTAQAALITAFSNPSLPLPVAPADKTSLEKLLSCARISGAEDIERQQVSDDDMELSWPDDVDPSLFDMMLNELPELTDQLSTELAALPKTGNLDSLRVIQRMAHTIKGLANMVGIKGLAMLTHCIEDIFDILVEHKVIPAKGLADALMEAADCLSAMTDFICTQGPKPTQAKAVSQGIHDWHYRLQVEGIDIATSAVPEPAADDSNTAQEAPAAPSAEADTVFRVHKRTVDRLLRLAGESSTLNAQLDEELAQLRGFTRQSRERQRNLQVLLEGLDRQLSEYYTFDPDMDSEDENFDPLEMDRYNEMHTLLSMLNEAADDMREVEANLDSHIRKVGELHLAQSGLQKESLDSVLSTRLVAVKTIVPRMQRIMRQACRAADKEAELVIVGEDLRVDSQILDQLADPLMHVIRNAVDHGLESADMRLLQGKSEQGRLSVAFSEKDGLIYVECKDDGSGIDLNRIKQVAVEKQLIDDDAELTDAEARRLILLPGFSTRDNVTQLSGRGIGMDVVYQQVMRMQGNLSITSETGVGTAFTLSLPSSSILVRALLVQVGDHIVTLAGHGVGQSLLSIDGTMRTDAEGKQWFDVGIDSYEAYTLESLLFEAPFDYSTKSAHPVLLVKQADGQKVAVLVREIMAHKELVFKETGPYVPDIPGIPGVTILSNGNAAIVVDLPSRVMFFNQRSFEANSRYEIPEAVTLPKLLVVDDSLSARKSLAVLLKDTGYEVVTAIDGVDALNQMRRERPDLILTDFEMPRMTGTELAEMVRSRDETAHIPMIMISSRSAAKHRAEADKAGISAYVTKPWTETKLLEQVEALLNPA
ncbi:MAG: hybrid sensor histidine kinase/response regulator [Pontibacterium sp.]